MEKVSVITVVFNDVKHIKDTMESFFSQTYENKEYIVIDGGSTDGTKEIIECYADRLAYWCSEPDGGIYDAMNKGISHATGDWINFLNCGDRFCADDTIEKVMDYSNGSTVDVIYGNSISDNGIQLNRQEASNDIDLLKYEAIYRHGCSFIKAKTQRSFPYDTSKINKYGFALDYDSIYRMYHTGCVFKKVSIDVQIYQAEGVSANYFKSLLYNFRITTQYGEKIKKLRFFLRRLLSHLVKRNIIFRITRAFLYEYYLNSIMPHIPIREIRNLSFRILGVKIGRETYIERKNFFLAPKLITIGSYCHINRGCLLDARGTITIGNNVSISHQVKLVTGSLEIDSMDFHGVYLPIKIKDYVWLGIGCTILQNVTIGKGAVVCAGAVVTKDVEPYSVVAGIPARKIRERSHHLAYHCMGKPKI